MKQSIKFLLTVYCLLFTTRCLRAQNNLVPNYSFEYNSLCPPFNVIQYTIPWFQPNKAGGASDIFDTCQHSFPDVPNCYSGYQWPHTGAAFAGISIFQDTIAGGWVDWSREYMEVQLIDSLTKDKKYCVGFYTYKQVMRNL